MIYRALAALALALPSFALPTMAEAQTLDPAQPRQIMAALQDMGYRATMSPYKSGRPRIRTSVEGIDYSIAFYSCRDDNTDCGALLFVKGYDLRNGLGFATVNQWNADRLIGRVYLDDENDPFIDYYVDAEFGIPHRTLEDIVEGWGRALLAFEDKIDWN